MFYQWLYNFSDVSAFFNVFRYVTFRTFASFFTAFLICYLLGPRFIQRFQRKQLQQILRDDWPKSNVKEKKNTVTMGGFLIMTSFVIPALLWVDLGNPLVLTTLAITLFFSAIGYVDDFLKIIQGNVKGVPGRIRLAAEFFISFSCLFILYKLGYLSSQLHLPFFKQPFLDLGLWYVPFASLVVVSCANGVNLTDGLDGLAIVPVVVCAGTLLIFAYVSGHFEISKYLLIPFVKGASELAPLAACLIAACLGFLWFNALSGYCIYGRYR